MVQPVEYIKVCQLDGNTVAVEGSATQQNCVRDYVIFQFLPRLHQDYTGITPGLHRDYTDF